MAEPRWIGKAVVLAVHDEQIAEHGGRAGLRDDGLLESALARPRNLFNYRTPDIPGIAAAYGFGLVSNHPFVDGNKRTSAVVTELFLALNDIALTLDDADIVTTWLALASGQLSETKLAEKLRASIRRTGSKRRTR